MLSLTDNNFENSEYDRPDLSQSKISIYDIFKSLNEIATKAKTIGEEEICYLTSVALESAREKVLLKNYEDA
jgi:hypothetical protein